MLCWNIILYVVSVIQKSPIFQSEQDCSFLEMTSTFSCVVCIWHWASVHYKWPLYPISNSSRCSTYVNWYSGWNEFGSPVIKGVKPSLYELSYPVKIFFDPEILRSILHIFVLNTDLWQIRQSRISEAGFSIFVNRKSAIRWCKQLMCFDNRKWITWLINERTCGHYYIKCASTYSSTRPVIQSQSRRSTASSATHAGGQWPQSTPAEKQKCQVWPWIWYIAAEKTRVNITVLSLSVSYSCFDTYKYKVSVTFYNKELWSFIH